MASTAPGERRVILFKEGKIRVPIQKKAQRTNGVSFKTQQINYSGDALYVRRSMRKPQTFVRFRGR